MAKNTAGPPGGGRDVTKRVKTARGRKLSSTRWLQRQLNDPYVQAAKTEGYRSRAAFKIIQLDERFGLFAKGQRIVDLGAAPGGWSQIARKRIGDVCIAEAMTLPEAKFFFGQLRRRDTTLNDAALHVRQALKAVEEPASHTRDLVNLLYGPTAPKRFD